MKAFPHSIQLNDFFSTKVLWRFELFLGRFHFWSLSPPGTLCFFMKTEVRLKLLPSSIQPRPLSPQMFSLGEAKRHLKCLSCFLWSSDWWPHVQYFPILPSPSIAIKIPSIFPTGEAASSEISFFGSVSWVVSEIVSKSERNGKYEHRLFQNKISCLFRTVIVKLEEKLQSLRCYFKRHEVNRFMLSHGRVASIYSKSEKNWVATQFMCTVVY